MHLVVEIVREGGGRWIAEIPALPGVLGYGDSRNQAIANVEAMALRVLADRLELGDAGPDLGSISFRVAEQQAQSRPPMGEPRSATRALLEGIVTDEHGDTRRAQSSESLVHLAEEAAAEHRAGKTKPLDPDAL